MGEDRYLTVAQVCDQLQVSRRTLERQIATGRLPVIRVGRLIRIRPADLEAAFSTPPAARRDRTPRRRPTRGK